MIKSILEFIHQAEKLKTEARNGFTSHDKHESVADHSWRLSLMTILLAPYLDKKISLEKAVKMAIIHDLPEIATGDQPYYKYEGDSKAKTKKHEAELLALNQVIAELPMNLKEEIFQLWIEFEKQESYEAKFVLALDKMEAQIQHNEAEFKHWNKYDLNFAATLLDRYCDFDSFLIKMKEIVQNESKNKISINS